MTIPSPNPIIEEPRSGKPEQPRWLVLAPVVAGVLLIAAAVILIVVFGVRNWLSGGETNPGMALSVIKLTATPFVPSAPSGCGTVLSSGDVQLAAPVPLSITVADRSFPVVAVVPDPSGWSYPPDGAGKAFWFCGTVVNYVFGFEPSAENRALLAGLRAGDGVKVYLSSGAQLLFRAAGRRETSANEPTVFTQNRPSLTLIVEGESGVWQAVTADYAAEAEPVLPPTVPVAQIGQLVSLGDVQVMVTASHAERQTPGLAPGTMYYVVEFTVHNLGAAALDASAFVMQLQDGLGNLYLLSPEASAFGDAGLMSGSVAPGETAAGSAGYLTPDPLAGPTLVWIFRPNPASELEASIGIPYQAETRPVSAGRAYVAITDAFLGDGVLYIEGEVQNVGDAPITIEVSGITLSSTAGLSAPRAVAPPLPWTIQPGDVQVFELQYDKPAASSALLSLAGFSFEISGL